ncbi:hypothetical protein GCM10027048_15900 [Hymenobacter coalescens]
MKRLLFLLLPLLSVAAASSVAQTPGSGGPTPSNEPPAAPTAVPLDGGVSLLVAGGAVYALSGLRKRRS